MSAKQNLFLPHPRGLRVFYQLLRFALFLLPLPLRAESLEDAAHELAMKVCLAAHNQPVKIAWQEFPQSPEYFSDAYRKAFLDQISACGMAPAETQGFIETGGNPLIDALDRRRTDASRAGTPRCSSQGWPQGPQGKLTGSRQRIVTSFR